MSLVQEIKWALEALLNPNSKFPGESALVYHGANRSQGSSIVTASGRSIVTSPFSWRGGAKKGFLREKGID